MNIPLDPQTLAVTPGAPLSLSKRKTKIRSVYSSKKHYKGLLEEHVSELSDLQRVMYAHGKYALLLIFQGMDAAGKDGAIRHVFSGVNPQGCQVFSFKQPSSEELDHDFLWRVHKRTPERGRIGIFNRSYYEEVLIVKAEPKILDAQRLPDECRDRPNFWEERYADINHFEDYLRRNGTVTLKFFLHLSYEEQRARFLSRIDDTDKNWKLTKADIESRSSWKTFQRVYEECLTHTSTTAAPWFVIPADDKRNARLLISHVIVENLRKLPLAYPEATKAHQAELQAIRHQLEKAKAKD
ncbi:MAG: polyphosphate kinase 2 family protein [Opitutales bacterium]|nr:polyphosphate kinase 2 family protein [Opitutales bacterium]